MLFIDNGEHGADGFGGRRLGYVRVHGVRSFLVNGCHARVPVDVRVPAVRPQAPTVDIDRIRRVVGRAGRGHNDVTVPKVASHGILRRQGAGRGHDRLRQFDAGVSSAHGLRDIRCRVNGYGAVEDLETTVDGRGRLVIGGRRRSDRGRGDHQRSVRHRRRPVHGRSSSIFVQRSLRRQYS